MPRIPQDRHKIACRVHELAAQRALELDEMLAEGARVPRYTLFHYFEFAASTKEFERAIELNPNYATASPVVCQDQSF